MSCDPVFNAFVELDSRTFTEQGDIEIRLSFAGV